MTESPEFQYLNPDDPIEHGDAYEYENEWFAVEEALVGKTASLLNTRVRRYIGSATPSFREVYNAALLDLGVAASRAKAVRLINEAMEQLHEGADLEYLLSVFRAAASQVRDKLK